MILSRVGVSEGNVTCMEAGLAGAVKQGFSFQSCPLRGSDDESFWEELNSVHNAVMASMPLYFDDPPGVSTPDGFRRFVNGGQYPNLDGRLFVARHGSDLVGYATVYVDGDRLHQGFTGVHPSFRRRDVALGLKALVFRFASTHDLDSVHTGSRSNNPPMLQLNRSLGFQEEQAELRLWKKLD